jgi:hypothetical protein
VTQSLLTTPQFAVDGPLPEGTTVLEASAGTGKTYTIAALATRYVADGIASPSVGRPPRSCGNGSGSGSSPPSAGWPRARRRRTR